MLPAAWPGYTARRLFRDTWYEITVRREGPGNAVALTVDGVAVDGDVVGGAGRYAGLDLADDLARVLVPRVVAGDDDVIGDVGRRQAHLRALAGIAVAAAAEHHDEPSAAADQPANGAQRLAERVGLVRVIDEDHEAAVVRHGLESPADRFHRLEARGNRLERNGQGLGHGRRRQRIPHVVKPQERRPDIDPAARRNERERRPREALLQPLCHHVGRVRNAVPQHLPGRQLGGVAGAGLVVGVEDRAALAIEALEQEALGVAVLGHRLVIVAVLARQVRERGDAEADTGGAPLVQGMARDLHDRRLQAALDHLGEVRGQVAGGRRRHRRRNLTPPDLVGDRADQARRPARLLEDAADEIRRRGLAARARDAANGQALRGITRQRMGRQAEGRMRIADNEERRLRGQVDGALDDRGPGPRIEGALDELVAVDLGAGERDKKIPLSHAPRIVHGARDLDIPRADEPAAGNPFGEFAQLHDLPLLRQTTRRATAQSVVRMFVSWLTRRALSCSVTDSEGGMPR